MNSALYTVRPDIGAEEPAVKVVPMPPIAGAEETYRRYSSMVYRLALARCRSKSDAEDVMQDVFTRYVRANPAFASAEHQRAWLVRTAINCSNTLLSSAWSSRRAELSEEVLNNLRAKSPDAESASDVYAAVLRLPVNQRTAIHLFYYEGYKVGEIASLTGSTESTVKSWLRRARTKLEKDLKGDYFDV